MPANGGAAPEALRSPLNHHSRRCATSVRLDRGIENGTTERKFVIDDSSLESLGSTPLTTYATSISEDGLSSLYDCAAFDFPEPPPIASPVIRRMRSSPWFMDNDDSNPLEDLPDPHRKLRMALGKYSQSGHRSSSSPENGAGLASQGQPVTLDGPESSVSSFSGNGLETRTIMGRSFGHTSCFDFQTENIDLELVGEALLRLDMNAPSHPSINCQLKEGSSASDLLQWSTSHRSTPTQSPIPVATYNQSCTTHIAGTQKVLQDTFPTERQNTRSVGRLPRIIRKVASMRSDAQKTDAPLPQLVSGHAGRKSIPKARSFRSILQSSEIDRARQRTEKSGGESYRPPSWLLASSSQSITRPEFSTAQLTHLRDSKQARPKPERNKAQCQHFSVSSSNVGLSASDPERSGSANAGVLAAPFLHRPFCNYASKKGRSNQDHLMAPSSFIDISPDREARGEPKGGKRERVKDFIARASTGIFGWGKHWRNKHSSIR
ncbi:hypothetical protein BDZ97DRAFT_680647 [Flammula alnicola]|nr:hypothetical protein BDZ97DRAFT_680647 [Flammula alnicola]